MTNNFDLELSFTQKFFILASLIYMIDVNNLHEDYYIQVEIDDERGGIFYIEFKNNKLNVEPYSYNDRHVIIKGKYNSLLKLFSRNETINNCNVYCYGDKFKAEKFFSVLNL